MLICINDIMWMLCLLRQYVDAVIVIIILFDYLLVVYSWEKAVE